MARIKEENEILKKAMAIFATQKLDKVVEFIDNNKNKYNIKTMCTVLGVVLNIKLFDASIITLFDAKKDSILQNIQ